MKLKGLTVTFKCNSSELSGNAVYTCGRNLEDAVDRNKVDHFPLPCSPPLSITHTVVLSLSALPLPFSLSSFHSRRTTGLGYNHICMKKT